MKTVIHLFLAFSLVLSSQVSAHDANLASFQLKVDDQYSSVSISVATSALESVLTQNYPDLDLASSSKLDIERYIVAYMRKHIAIKSSGCAISLGKGLIRLGAHQTDIRFLVDGLPQDLTNITYVFSAFDQNPGQVNILEINDHGVKRKVFLTEKNDFQHSFSSQKGIEEFKGNSMDADMGIWTIALVLTVIIIYGLMFKRNKMLALVKSPQHSS